MNFNYFGIFVCALAFLHANAGNAYCREHVIDNLGDEFQITYNCENTENFVEYQIIRQITKNIDFEFFTLDPQGWNLMCSKLSYDDEILDEQCIQTGLTRNTTYDLGSKTFSFELNSDERRLTNIYLDWKDYNFIYPKFAELYPEFGCAIFVKSNDILIFLMDQGLDASAECLLQYELHLSRK